MDSDRKRSVAAVGDTADPATWSGIPFHFLEAAKARGFATEPWRVDLSQIKWQRYLWNLGQVLRGGSGGFQYSRWFLNLASAQVPEALFRTEVITFNQHFPNHESVVAAGGILNHYLDAPFVALASGRGLDLRLPRNVVQTACESERANYEATKRVITMGRWAAEVIIKECDVPSEKVFTILPGANLKLPKDWAFPGPRGRAGKERDFILGFVGKEWERKGLPLIIEVRDDLARRGWRVKVNVAGHAPLELSEREGVNFVGFIDKRTSAPRFLEFLTGCDVGCLFSQREALGISTLEFLRAGVPVAGYAVEGPADTLPPDAGFRFDPKATASEIADVFEGYLNDEPRQAEYRRNAREWSAVVTWERCIAEFEELWATGVVKSPVRPWLGLRKVNA